MSFIKDLYKKNAERQIEWDASDKIDVLFKAVEFVGEVGELCNNIKKIKREELGLAGSRCSRDDLESEFGDVLITLALLADHLKIDLEEVTKDKFNATSEKMGFDTKFKDDEFIVQILLADSITENIISNIVVSELIINTSKSTSVDHIAGLIRDYINDNKNIIGSEIYLSISQVKNFVENTINLNNNILVLPNKVMRNGIYCNPIIKIIR